jgi:hypothetical protein
MHVVYAASRIRPFGLFAASRSLALKRRPARRVARPIMTKPKPAPKPVEKEAKPAADAKAEDAGPQEVKKEDTATPMDTEGDTSKAGEVKAEPIETDE